MCILKHTTKFCSSILHAYVCILCVCVWHTYMKVSARKQQNFVHDEINDWTNSLFTIYVWALHRLLIAIDNVTVSAFVILNR